VVGLGEVKTQVGAGTVIEIPWQRQKEGEVIRVAIRAFDADGFWSEMELCPWSYKVPHEDINFATNSSEITPIEEYKLKDALAKVQETIRKYGADLVTINLYVAGHTDTVGDAAHNRELSMKRALAIARWFKDNGFEGTIYYQGFGESDPLVATGDNVDEPKNRRVDYVMASQSPGGSWQKL
jgi:outer membrane protein OmpA-like peptidoglycan-associated protein